MPPASGDGLEWCSPWDPTSRDAPMSGKKLAFQNQCVWLAARPRFRRSSRGCSAMNPFRCACDAHTCSGHHPVPATTAIPAQRSRACARTTSRRGDNRWVRGRTAVNGLCPGGAPAARAGSRRIPCAICVAPARLPRRNRTGSNRNRTGSGSNETRREFPGEGGSRPRAPKKSKDRDGV